MDGLIWRVVIYKCSHFHSTDSFCAILICLVFGTPRSQQQVKAAQFNPEQLSIIVHDHFPYFCTAIFFTYSCSKSFRTSYH